MVQRRQKYSDTVAGNRGGQDNVIDFSQKKLLAIAKQLTPRLRKKILQLLAKYMNHQIAILWIGGSPSYVYLSNHASDDNDGDDSASNKCK